MSVSHFYAPINRENQAIQALFSLITFEENKMQTYDTTGANSAQHYQPNQSNQITFVVVFLLALFLAYAVNQHLITDAFSYCMAQLFQHFSISGGSIYSDIALLILLSLALFGLFCLFKFFFIVTVSVVIIAVLAAVFFAPDTSKPLTLKDSLVKEKRATDYENIGG